MAYTLLNDARLLKDDATGALVVKLDGGATFVLSTTDIEIGAVELKDATSENRALISAGGAVKVDASGTAVPVQDGGGSLTVDGAVSVSNLPSTQNVSDGGGSLTVDGSVGVNNFPATQPVSGAVGVNNFPATQPVSAAALPLPTGAATEATAAGVKTGTDRIPAQVSSRLPTIRAIDTGRSNVVLGFDGALGIAAEALASISGVRGNAAVSGATTQTVTAGKTLRIMSMRAVVMAGGAVVVNAKVRLRANYSGAATATSPVYAELRPGIISATAIANQVSPDETLFFPDGLELPAGASLGISHVMTGTVTGTQVSCQIVGFEY